VRGACAVAVPLSFGLGHLGPAIDEFLGATRKSSSTSISTTGR